jgi:hypothetical protein
MDKRSSLLRKFVNFGQKSFITSVPVDLRSRVWGDEAWLWWGGSRRWSQISLQVRKRLRCWVVWSTWHFVYTPVIRREKRGPLIYPCIHSTELECRFLGIWEVFEAKFMQNLCYNCIFNKNGRCLPKTFDCIFKIRSIKKKTYRNLP